jgi:hypothetical protein
LGTVRYVIAESFITMIGERYSPLLQRPLACGPPQFAAFATEAIEAVGLSARKAARIVSSIGVLHLWPDEMFGPDE